MLPIQLWSVKVMLSQSAMKDDKTNPFMHGFQHTLVANPLTATSKLIIGYLVNPTLSGPFSLDSKSHRSFLPDAGK